MAFQLDLLEKRRLNPEAHHTYARAMTLSQSVHCARTAPLYEQVSISNANEMQHRGLRKKEATADAAAVTILANELLAKDQSLAPEEAIRIAATVRTHMMHHVAPAHPTAARRDG